MNKEGEKHNGKNYCSDDNKRDDKVKNFVDKYLNNSQSSHGKAT